MSEPGRAFEAPDLIAVMDEAVRYNRFLVQSLLAWSPPGGRILDFGAGNGRFVRALAAHGLDVHAIEPDPQLRASIEAASIPSHASLDALGTMRFDGIYSINVLEHIEEDRALVRRFHDLLHPGGRLLLYVPAFEVLFSANDVRVGHLRRYRRAGLVDLVRAAGFRVESARYVDSLGFLTALLYRLVGDREGGLNPTVVRIYDGAIFPVSRLLDRVFGRLAGKNLLLTAVRPPTSPDAA